MRTEYDDYDIEKSAYYTEQMIELARRRWGDIPLSPQTHTWTDGTVSVHVEHNICDKYHPSLCYTVRLTSHETGFQGVGYPMIREAMDEGPSDGRSTVWYEEFAADELIELW